MIPTYGRAEFLREAIQSVLNGGIGDVEVVVVDDASPIPVPNNFGDRRVRLVRLPTNQGPAAARNIGIQAARAEVCAFLDDDDVFTSQRLPLALKHVAPGVMAMCEVGRLGTASSNSRRLIDFPLFDGYVRDTVLDGAVPSLGQATFHKDDFVPLNESLRSAEDSDWWLRMSEKVRVVSVRAQGYLVRDHDGERHGRDAEVRLQNRLVLLQIHSQYFADRPRARARLNERIASAALLAARPQLALRHALRAMRYPSVPRARLLARSVIFRRKAMLVGD